MTKRRVSVKGKGADIFFGDFGGTQVPAEPSTDAPLPPAEPEPRTIIESNLASKKASRQESTSANKRAGKQEKQSAAAAPPGGTTKGELRSLLAAVWQPVNERATVTNAFRYTDQDLSALEDVIYDIHRKHKVKLTKQDVARLGLNALLLDYQLNGDASLLGEFARKRRQRAEGEF